MFNYNNTIPEDLLNKVKLNITCSAYPEQYDMFFDGKYVAYFRLRHGSYTVTEPFSVTDPQILYEAYTYGDGEFMGNEREFFLTMGIASVLNHFGELNIVGEIPTSMNEKQRPKHYEGKPTIRFD